MDENLVIVFPGSWWYRKVRKMLSLNDNCLIWPSVIILSYLHGRMKAALDTETLFFGLRKRQEAIIEIVFELNCSSQVSQFNPYFYV